MKRPAISFGPVLVVLSDTVRGFDVRIDGPHTMRYFDVLIDGADVGSASTVEGDASVEGYLGGTGEYLASLHRNAPAWTRGEHGEDYEFDTGTTVAAAARRAVKAVLLARWADYQAGYSAPVPRGPSRWARFPKRSGSGPH